MAESVLMDVGNNWETNRGEGPGTFQPAGYHDPMMGGLTPGVAPTSGGGSGGGGWMRGSGWGGDLNYAVPFLAPLKLPRFAAPSLEEAMATPGYMMRMKAGQDALEKSAAAKGVLRTGGHLKDLTSWSQDFASREYDNVLKRALDMFDRNYRAQYDEYGPTKDVWRAELDREKTTALGNFEKQFNAWEIGQHNAQQANMAKQQALISAAGL